MPRSHVVRSNFLSGVLDPRAAGRVETESYNQGLLRGVNVEPVHLGGMRRRAGTRFRDTLPNRLTRVTGQTITAPNGGTTGNANDDSESTLLTTTTDVSTVDPFVVVHYDLGAAADINFADVRGIRSTGSTSAEFRVQYSTDNAAWTDLGDAFEVVDTTIRSYRRGSTTPVSARYWRVAKVGGTTMGAVDTSTGDFSLWNDTASTSPVAMYAFEVTTDEAYLAVFTDRSLRLYDYPNATLVVDLPSPFGSDDLEAVDGAQNQDSMVFVHEDFQPRFLIPEAGTFFFDLVGYEEIPQYDFDDSSSPTPTSEVQVITFGSGFAPGDTFQIDLEGARTGAVTYAGDSSADERSSTADNLAREIQKLYTVPGFTGVSCARTNTDEYTVTFAEASAKTYELMSGVTLASKDSTNVGITITQTTPGVSRAEDAWSATRGWPRSVTFFEGRMYHGGSRSLPQSLFGSKVGRILNFLVDEALDDDGILTTLENQQLNAIQGVFSGRALQFFTSGGEFRYAKQQGIPVTPADAPVAQTQYGGAKIRPESIDGATVFVQRNGKTVRDFRYDYEEDAYNSLGLSSLAPHLVNDVQKIAAWNGSSTDEISLVFVVNGDGTIALMNTRRDAGVLAWTQWTTQGLFKAVRAVNDHVYMAVKRAVDGVSHLFLEQRDRALYTDCAVSGATITVVTVVDVTQPLPASWGTYTHTIETSVNHTLSVGDVIDISGVIASGSYQIPDGQYAVITVPDDTHIRIKVENLTGTRTGGYSSGGTFGVGSATTFSGLDHLDGEECRVKGDGFVLESQTPVAGAIESEYAANSFEVGFNFNSDITPMPLNTMTPAGENFMRRRRVSKVWLRVHETLGLLINGRVISNRRMDISNFDEPVTPYSGVLELSESSNWDAREDKLVSITQVDPLPMEVLAIDVALEWNE